MKKIFTSLMALAIAMTTFAYDQAVEGTDYYGSNCRAVGLADGTVAVVEYYLQDDATIWIPATIQLGEGDPWVMTAEYEVSQVGNADWGFIWAKQNDAAANNTVTKIIIAEGVQRINTSAFATWVYDGVEPATQFTALAEVELPSTLTSIGDYAFNFADALTSIKCAAASAPAVGTDAFKGNEAWDKIITNCTVYVPSEAAKATYNQDPWTYWTAFYGNNRIVVDAGTAIGKTDADSNAKARKIIRNGQVLIERNGVFFDLTGSVVK